VSQHMASRIFVSNNWSLGKNHHFHSREGDVEVPVGGMIIFSGSKAHAGMAYCFYNVFVFRTHTLKGSGYLIGNRRLHFYFLAQTLGKNAVINIHERVSLKVSCISKVLVAFVSKNQDVLSFECCELKSFIEWISKKKTF
jgi:hypothetical protein